jgi:hypothetical protein
MFFSKMIFRMKLVAPCSLVFILLVQATTCSQTAVVLAKSASLPLGASGNVGCGMNPTRVERLSITRPGTYENILVDGQWTDSTLVKITADNVTLRNCEIRNGRHNAVTVYARDVTIDSCKIHHVLAGTYDDQQDAHGITGRPTNLTIRNCDIGLTSGDSIQFDPGRGQWDNVLIENCTLWTGPLPADAAGFKRGQRPGENAVDTKQRASNPRSRITIRNCVFRGWNQPSQISNMAALNLKNHVEARIENCVFQDNEICFRVRGGTGRYGGALVTIDRCAVYESQVAVRAEDEIRGLKIRRLGLGAGVAKRIVTVGDELGPGFEDVEEFQPPPFAKAIELGVSR